MRDKCSRYFLAVVGGDGKGRIIVVGKKRLVLVGGVWWLPGRIVGEMRARGVEMSGAWVSRS